MELVSRYSGFVSDKIGNEQFLIQNFTLRRAFEGPQVILCWDAPENTSVVSEIRVVRKLLSYPVGPNDGKIVYSGSAQSGVFSDTETMPESGYLYYTFFSFRDDINDYVSVAGARKSILVFDVGDYYWWYLWNLVPEGYRLAGKRLDLDDSGEVNLFPIQDNDTEEFYNIYEEDEDPKNLLKRVFKLFGTALGEIKGLIDAFDHQFSPDTLRIEYLEMLAHYIGLTLTEDLPGQNQRQNIKQHVALLKIKGSKLALASKLRSITLLEVEVKDVNNILQMLYCPNSNQDSCLLDGNKVLYGGGIKAIEIIFHLTSSVTVLTRAMLDTIWRTIPLWVPACVQQENVITCFSDEVYQETYSVETEISDTYFSCIEQEKAIEDLRQVNRYIVGHLEHFVSDSDRYIYSGLPFVRDGWFDSFEKEDTYQENVFGYRCIIVSSLQNEVSSRLVLCGESEISSIQDNYFDEFERDVDQDQYVPYWKFIVVSGLENEVSNSSKAIIGNSIACDSWWDDITQNPVVPSLVSRYSDSEDVILPDAGLVSRYGEETTVEIALFSRYSEVVQGTPSP